MMTTYHIRCGAVVRILPGVSEVPGSNSEWNFFSFFFLIRPIIITLINFFFYSYSGWSLGVAILGICIPSNILWELIFFICTVGGAWVWLFRVYVYTMGVIFGHFFSA